MKLSDWIAPELVALFTIVAFSILIVRAGALALKKTGLSWESSLFQSQSAFMGVGFTTSESESVVTHAVRRKIIRILMLLGFGSIIGTLGTTMVTFASKSTGQPAKFAGLGVFLIVLWLGWKIRPLERILDTVISRALERVTTLHTMDFESVLNLDKGYTVAVVHVEDDDSWLAARTLRQLELAEEGVLVLSITRSDSTVLGTPSSRIEILSGDKLLCYGLEDVLEELSMRRCGQTGDSAHESAKQRQRMRVTEEKVVDAHREAPSPA